MARGNFLSRHGAHTANRIPSGHWRERACAIASAIVWRLVFCLTVHSRHYRKVKLLFGLADVAIVAMAIEAAYRTRSWLGPVLYLHYVLFYLDQAVLALLLEVTALLYLAIGHWFDIYEKLDSALPRTVLRNTFRQCVMGSMGLVLVEYVLRLDLSRVFVGCFCVYS
jgi:hypothetical protein